MQAESKTYGAGVSIIKVDQCTYIGSYRFNVVDAAEAAHLVLLSLRLEHEDQLSEATSMTISVHEVAIDE